MKKQTFEQKLRLTYNIAALVGIPRELSTFCWNDKQREAFTVAEAALDSLRRIERKLHRLHEQACNGVMRYVNGRMQPTWEDADQDANDAACAKLLARAEKLTKPFGWTVEEQGDPRGGALYLKDKDGRDLGHVLYF